MLICACVTALVRVAEPIALTSIFPYAWKLVLHFHVGDKSNASFYAGLLIAAFALAESVTGMYVHTKHSYTHARFRRHANRSTGIGEDFRIG